MKYVIIYNENKLIIYNERLSDNTVPYTLNNILIFNLKAERDNFITLNNLTTIT